MKGYHKEWRLADNFNGFRIDWVPNAMRVNNDKEEGKMKAIVTKYAGPTNVRGSRIIASDDDGNRVIVSYDSALGSSDNHKQAAARLCEKMNWKGTMYGGHLKHGMVFTWEDEENEITIT